MKVCVACGKEKVVTQSVGEGAPRLVPGVCCLEAAPFCDDCVARLYADAMDRYRRALSVEATPKAAVCVDQQGNILAALETTA